MISHERSLKATLLAFCCILWSIASLHSESSYTVRSLEEALRALQEKGLNILFSSDLVRPDMMVQEEPVSSAPTQKLDELLSPHGLRWITGPRNTLLVVEQENKTANVESKRAAAGRSFRAVSSHMVVPFVTVYLTAQDSDGDFVTQLKAEHLMLKEDGTEQQIVDFTNVSEMDKLQESPTITFFFLIDVSQSMTRVLDHVPNFQLFQQAAVAMGEQLGPGDQAKLLAFNHELRAIQDTTSDKDLVRSQLRSMQETGGKTAILDAMLHLVDDSRNYNGRKIIIVFSDGLDNISKASMDEVLASLKSSDVTVFAFGTPSHDAFSQRGVQLLEKITEVTGGFAYFPKTLNDVSSSAAKLHQAILSQYAAGYIPPSPSLRKWRQVEIKCKLRGIRLRYRKAYLF